VTTIERDFARISLLNSPDLTLSMMAKALVGAYFGHACILLETNDVSVLLDPVLSYTYESYISRYTYEDLPEVIDYVLIRTIIKTTFCLRPCCSFVTASGTSSCHGTAQAHCKILP